MRLYFPHNAGQKYKMVNELFGDRRVADMIMNVEPYLRHDVVATLVAESENRANDPVRGSFGIAQRLDKEISDSLDELELVTQLIHEAVRMAVPEAELEPLPPPPQPRLPPVNVQGVLGTWHDHDQNLVPRFEL